MRREDMDAAQPFHVCPDCHERDGRHGAGCPSDESDRAVARAQRLTVRSVQRTLAGVPDVTMVPVGTGRLRSREEDR